MRKKTNILIIVFIAALMVSACSEKKQHQTIETAGVISKIIEQNGYRFILDLQTLDAHLKMMKDMGMSMEGMKHEGNRVLMLTIMDPKTSKMVKADKVEFVISRGEGQAELKTGFLMAEKGMVHCASAFFQPKDVPLYVKAKITLENQEIEVSSEF